MRTIAHAAALAACTLSACTTAPAGTPAEGGPLGPYAALAGHWRGAGPQGVIEEIWMPPDGANMTGAFRSIDAHGRVTMLELLTLAADRDAVRMRLRHFDPALTPWASEADGPVVARAAGVDGGVLTFVFESDDRAADLTYDLSRPDRLTVTLRFHGATEPLVLGFERVR